MAQGLKKKTTATGDGHVIANSSAWFLLVPEQGRERPLLLLVVIGKKFGFLGLIRIAVAGLERLLLSRPPRYVWLGNVRLV